ncbi:transporter [Legionella maioricensis]|uniref:Transporter n=1 Tax=Legionella maioricensis TaxID=2896528 RepID=A0A9X2IBA8_9GAMM|nr:transporter [Legionella maioricensis]MCL9684290.1 transporter [Legionella maioricensis]MCL9687156.1 transporter [Legionella maioricensis]
MLFYFILLFTLLFPLDAISSNDTPCGGPTNLLAIIDRPSFADSACVTPDKTVILESGYEDLTLLGGGRQQNFPEAFLRFGLADRFEFNIFLPNYVHQTVLPYKGYDPSTLGVKHEIAASTQWVIAIDGYLILPSGSVNFGSERAGGIFNGLFSYNITSEISLSGMLGLSSQTLSINAGGQRYNSINPDLVLSWTKEKISIYGEIYGQSKTGPQQGSGFITDAGVLYQIKKNIVIDLEAGHRISGVLDGFSYYWGTGISIQFS